jgi:hypothetical protein
MCERIKEERSNYKNAWDVTDKKFVQSKKNWENEKFELLNKIRELEAQIQTAMSTSVLKADVSFTMRQNEL